MEFKGTKGEWKRFKLEKGVYSTETNEIHYGIDGECVAEYVSNDYDALLISKAPEMLEMLNELKRRIEIVQSEPNGIVRESMIRNMDIDLHELIKQATKL